ncbi:MAG: ABC transporter permease [Acidimicrobiales bacterium]
MLRVEFIRQVKRRRTWGMVAAITIVPVLVAIANKTQGGRPELRRNLFSLGTHNGVNFAAFTLLLMSNFFLVVVIAAFAGESVAGEATWGTLRYLLIRPVARPKLIAAKLAIAALLAAASTALVSIVALLIGSAFFGWSDVLIIGRTRLVPFELIGPWAGVGRLIIASGYVTVCMLFVVAVGLFLSTLTDSTAAAVVSTIVVVVTCSVLLNVPSLAGIRPIVPTNYWAEWNFLFYARGGVELWKGLVSSAVYTSIFSALAIARFQRKDIVS